MRISIRTNLDQIAKQIDAAARDQVPFAIALTLTRTARDVQTTLRDTLADYFTVRGTWVPKSIQIDQAKKGHEPVARAGSLYAPMEMQAAGGTKGGAHGHDVAVPIRARFRKTSRTPRGKWPGALAKRSDFFLAPFGGGVVGDASDGASGVGLFQRIGKKGGKRRLRLWWLIEPEVKVEPRWPFEQLARATVEREIVDNFWAAMEQAIATRK